MSSPAPVIKKIIKKFIKRFIKRFIKKFIKRYIVGTGLSPPDPMSGSGHE